MINISSMLIATIAFLILIKLIIHIINAIPTSGRLASFISIDGCNIGSAQYASCTGNGSSTQYSDCICPKTLEKSETIVIHSVANQVFILLNCFFIF